MITNLYSFKKISVLFLVLISIFTFQNLYADKNIESIYTKYKDKILSEKYKVIDNYVFYVGTANIKDYFDDESSNEIYSDASFNADATLLNIISSKAKFPKQFSRDLVGELKQSFLDLKETQIRANKEIVVDRFKKNKTYYVIKVLPYVNVIFKKNTYQDIKKTLEQAFLDNNERLSPSAYLEICSPKQLGEVINFYSKVGEAEFNKQLELFIRGDKLSAISDLNIEVYNTLMKIKNNQSINDYFKGLSIVPYHPKLCFYLGNAFEKKGFHRNANLFYLRGTKWPVDIKVNELCRKKITIPYFKSKAGKPMSAEWLSLRKQIESKKAELENGWAPTSELIIKCLGTIPVLNETVTKSYYKGMEQYNNNNLNEALNLFLEELNNNISSPNCNMIGNCLYYLNHEELALPFFMQSLEMNPDNIDSLIHTAFIFEYLGYLNKAKKYAVKLKESGNIPEWSKEQINRIISR